MKKETSLDTARRVISDEAKALNLLSTSLDDGFSKAIDTIRKTTGRVIVSGMGKSGHIARKIAATLASTGTPSFFVHPAEASHGDLGMLTRHDVALVLSNSGETPELAAIITYTRRFNIPLIGVASRKDSALIRQADIAILLPDAKEVCPMGLAPTTSTTMTLALGDAIAVALMQEHDITPSQFSDFHPGGKLGARLTKVRDLMHTDLPLVRTQTPMGETLIAMSEKSFGLVGVTDGTGQLVGVITDGDLRRNMDGLMDLSAGDVMTKDPKTIAPDQLAQEGLAAMAGKITGLFVVEPGLEKQAVGILHIHDCLRAGVA